jgi:hypothetical protein
LKQTRPYADNATPPAKGDLRIVNISSVKAALEKLDLDIPIEVVLKIINEEDEAMRSQEAVEGDERARRKLAGRLIPRLAGIDLSNDSSRVTGLPLAAY